MCGIYGIAGLDWNPSLDREVLARMGRVIVHRGPDDDGHFYNGGVGLGMRRLSIIDLKGGHQPIANEDETIWVVCNGEIYNFKELRDELEKKGHHFRTHSDTEVIVHLYEDFGVDLFKRLRGMFAIAVWDAQRKRLVQPGIVSARSLSTSHDSLAGCFLRRRSNRFSRITPFQESLIIRLSTNILLSAMCRLL